MTSPWFEDDDQLLEELTQARVDDKPDPAQAEMLMIGYDMVMADTLEAALLHDSDVDATAAVRSEEAGARMLTYGSDELEIDFELVDGMIVGHIAPPQDGRMLLEQPTAGQETDRTEPVEPDELGSFEFTMRHPGTFRLRFVRPDGQSITTDWLDGPHQTRR